MSGRDKRICIEILLAGSAVSTPGSSADNVGDACKVDGLYTGRILPPVTDKSKGFLHSGHIAARLLLTCGRLPALHR